MSTCDWLFQIDFKKRKLLKRRAFAEKDMETHISTTGVALSTTTGLPEIRKPSPFDNHFELKFRVIRFAIVPAVKGLEHCHLICKGWMTYVCVYECCVIVVEGVGCVGMKTCEFALCPCVIAYRKAEGCKRLRRKFVDVVQIEEAVSDYHVMSAGFCTKSCVLLPVNFARIPLLNSKMESSKSKVRTWTDTSPNMNSLLKSRHVSRIGQTPFKCCLGIVQPIQLNLKLLKQLHQSFRVRQQFVSFDVVDVVMTLGLGVGGLEISFDESIVGKVGDVLNSSETKAKDLVNMFDNIVGDDDLDVDVVNSRHVSNMPCLLLDDLDSLCNYDWSGAIHTYLVHSLNRCNKKILTGKIADSVSISGSAVVLQVWVYERLGLHSHPSCRVFPRLMGFRSVSYGTEEIHHLFRQGEVHFDWYIGSVEREDPIVRRAFNMDALARTAEEPEKGENSCEPPRAGRLEQVRKNNQKIKSLKDEIVAIRKALSERRKRARFDLNISVEEGGFDVVGEGNEGSLEEAGVDDTVADGAGVDEGVADEAAFGETTGHEQERSAAPVDEGVADEEAFGQTAAHEEETTSAPVDEDATNAAAVAGCAASEAAVAGCAASEAGVDGSAATTTPVDAATALAAPVDEAAAPATPVAKAAAPAAPVAEAAAPAARVDEVAAPAAAVDEARAIDEPVHEADENVDEELPPRDAPAFVDIGGDDDDADQLILVVQPLVVEPLSTIPADVIARVDLAKLYQCVTRKDIVISYVSEIMGQLLTTRDCSSLGPRECVDNMVIIFAATMFMYFEKRSTGVIKRMIFSPMFGSHLLTDNKRRVAKRQVWQLNDYQAYFRQDLVRLHDLLSADWVFIPVVTKNHWWCYALRPCTMQFFVIDSLDKGISGRGSIDRSIVRFTVEVQLSLMKLLAKNIQRFWGMLSNTFEDSKIPFNIEQAKIPVQPNTLDCDLIMMKVMEIWDGEDKYDGKSMPDYSNEELAAFRRKYICDWILDGENIRILGVLQHYGLQIRFVIAYGEDVSDYLVSTWILRCSQVGVGGQDGCNYMVPEYKVHGFCTESWWVLTAIVDADPKWVLGAKMDAITWSLSTRVGSFEVLCYFHMQLGFVIAYGEDVSDYQTLLPSGCWGPRWMQLQDAAPKWVLRAKMDAIIGGCKRLPGQCMDSVLNLDAAPKWVLGAKKDAITGSLSTCVG
ncbi:hypothetical protein V8G54_021782 [Vigna mungo]|uniref:Ubiquitin-like protease family profile domain-containing protein n=1 Tax=Vigna mungo TaxID=3915 RepID=A0AAQ3NG81_VIGMU